MVNNDQFFHVFHVNFDFYLNMNKKFSIFNFQTNWLIMANFCMICIELHAEKMAMQLHNSCMLLLLFELRGNFLKIASFASEFVFFLNMLLVYIRQEIKEKAGN